MSDPSASPHDVVTPEPDAITRQHDGSTPKPDAGKPQPDAGKPQPDADAPRYAVVIPTIGRDSLHQLLAALASQDGPAPVEVVVVDDRRCPEPPLQLDVTGLDATELDATPRGPCPVRVLPGFGRGPAAARNLGWRVTSAEWVAFVDDDVDLPQGWATRLVDDLRACPPEVAGSQAQLTVPLPSGRRPTDWERSTAGLERSSWVTADMAYRRTALLQVHGFDERFPRAYREDADLAVRVRDAGWRLVRGRRTSLHPVRPVDDWVSVRVQRGNADDALLRRRYGARWREQAATGHGRLPWHVGTVLAGSAALVGLATCLLPPGGVARQARRYTAVTGLLWTGLTAEFTWRRVAPGPRDAAEMRRMVLTSAVIPPAAVWHRLRGARRHRRATSWPPPVRAVLFDRDGTLVHDVPYNGDPDKVRFVDGAAEAVARLRRSGVRVGVVTNQSGVARGLLTMDQVAAVNAVVDRRLGPFDTWQVCPHGPDEGCSCRKPRPGMVRAGARALRVDVEQCAVVGDIGADVEAARAAGARGVLVPGAATRAQEVADAPWTATDLAGACDLLLGAEAR